jgi:hypothetical protein
MKTVLTRCVLFSSSSSSAYSCALGTCQLRGSDSIKARDNSVEIQNCFGGQWVE